MSGLPLTYAGVMYDRTAPLAEQAIAAALKSHEGPRAGMHLETDSHDAFQSGDG